MEAIASMDRLTFYMAALALYLIYHMGRHGAVLTTGEMFKDALTFGAGVVVYHFLAAFTARR